MRGKGRQGVPWEERGLALLGGRDREDVLHKRHLPAARRSAPPDAGEAVVQRVLPVKTAEKRHDGPVEHVAVEEIFDEAVQQGDRQESAGKADGARPDLGPPDPRGATSFRSTARAASDAATVGQTGEGRIFPRRADAGFLDSKRTLHEMSFGSPGVATRLRRKTPPNEEIGVNPPRAHP